jgi:hypothetical protein
MRILSIHGRWRRTAAWTCFALALAGLSWALDAWLPPVPLWTREGGYHSLGIAHDGGTFRTAAIHRETGDHVGPVQGWDVRTGRETFRGLDLPGDVINAVDFSDDGQILTAVTRGLGKRTDRLWCIDMATGEERQLALSKSSSRWEVSCGPQGRLIAVSVFADPKASDSRVDLPQLLLFDTQPFRMLAMLPAPRHWQWAADGNALFAYRKDEESKPWLRRIARDSDTEIYLKGAGTEDAFAANGRRLITSALSDDLRDGKDRDTSMLVWDLAAIMQPGYLPTRVTHALAPYWPAVLADNRTMVTGLRAAGGAPTLAVWDLSEQRAIGRLDAAAEHARIEGVDGTDLFMVTAMDEKRAYLAVYDPRRLTKLWERRWTVAIGRVESIPDAGALVVAYEEKDIAHIELIDTATGELRLRIAPAEYIWFRTAGAAFALIECHELRPESRGKLYEFIAWLRATLGLDDADDDDAFTRARVFDAVRGEEVLRVDVPGVAGVHLAPDGKSLLCLRHIVLDTDVVRIMCYTVPRRVSWMRVAMVPLVASAFFVVFVGGRRLLRRWRASRTAGATPTPR